MRLTLHDNILAGAGERMPPDARPRVGEAARAHWVRAMHRRLVKAPAGAEPFAAQFDTGHWSLRTRIVRHGHALVAVWGDGADGRVVAVSVLLAGAASADDKAALDALCAGLPPHSFGAADRSRLAGEHRPCLGTVYLDASWFDNGRVELAATSLALAALFGPEGHLSVDGEAGAPDAVRGPLAAPIPAESERLGDAAAPAQFDFTPQRLGVVMDMVKKKAAASMAREEGVHFRVEPPPEFLEHPGVLRHRGVFGRLKDSTWKVTWHDGRTDRLAFGELLGFLDQVVEVEKAMDLVNARPRPGEPPRDAGRDPDQPPQARRAIRVNRTLDARALVRDANIRRLFASVTGPAGELLRCSVAAGAK